LLVDPVPISTVVMATVACHTADGCCDAVMDVGLVEVVEVLGRTVRFKDDDVVCGASSG
jgi:hypothetical protein